MVTYALSVTTESDCIRISILGSKRESTCWTFVNTPKKSPSSMLGIPGNRGTASKNGSYLNVEADDTDHRYEGVKLVTRDLLLAFFGDSRAES